MSTKTTSVKKYIVQASSVDGHDGGDSESEQSCGEESDVGSLKDFVVSDSEPVDEETSQSSVEDESSSSVRPRSQKRKRSRVVYSDSDSEEPVSKRYTQPNGSDDNVNELSDTSDNHEQSLLDCFSRLTKNIHEPITATLVVKVIHIGEISRRSKARIQTRTIIVVDETFCTINLVLVGQRALNFHHRLGDIIKIVKGRIVEFRNNFVLNVDENADIYAGRGERADILQRWWEGQEDSGERISLLQPFSRCIV
jgi:hypothetical protein